MAATSTRQATSGATQEFVPACPECRSEMVVRAQWGAARVTGLYWGCRRAPGCEGARRIRSPETIQPYAHDASAQAIFDWEARREMTAPPAPAAGLRGLFGRVLDREPEYVDPSYAAPADSDPVGYFDALVEHGFVILEQRSLPAARVHLDNVIVGPSGIYVVERKAWAGQVMATADSIFVDGRERAAATEDILRAADAFDETLAHELKPLGVWARPAMLFERAANKSFEGVVNGVSIGGTRGLPKVIRGRDEPVMGPETIVRLAVAVDRLLE